ncbi:tetratricopeptide repeat protein [Clostridium aminobutyricum]|uniref:Tetratricopeptide repeat protein n=1 Tax=Clostridium aminobutyricum TaxID=33953 RepID=A0A939DA61_CLOAM|nr:tetratricopeptide repeat protein [Clostridium aminobutyricum]MBN7774229.1 tetratricopeptide repeat protein [Clostridium aminobutyricum]
MKKLKDTRNKEQEAAEPKRNTLLSKMGLDNPVNRSDSETDIRKRPDRVGLYLKKYGSNFVFDEFSDAFLEKTGTKDLMKGVPIPLRQEDLEAFQGGEGLSTLHIAENMAWIMGIDPKFKYTEHYIAFLLKLYNYKIYEGILKEGRDAAEKEDFDSACIHFRATLCMKPDYLHGMYSYARVCREMYLKSTDEEYIGRFKAESIDYFELITEEHPNFAQAYYYLGYAYINMGLYTKAELAWKNFIDKSHNSQDRKEIKERMKQIADPIMIEKGCNDVMAGRYEYGLAILEPFLKTQFKTWWPLSYYLGVAHLALGDKKEAVTSFKRVLTINGSHLESMQALADIYASDGDRDNEVKYRKKIELVQENLKSSFS